MIRSLLVTLLAVLLASPALAAQEIPVVKASDGLSYTILVNDNYAIDDFTAPIPGCAVMNVTFAPGRSSVVSAYATDADTTPTAAEIEADTLLDALSSSDTAHGPFTPTKAEVRFVVDTATVGNTPSEITVTCEPWAAVDYREQLLGTFKFEGQTAMNIAAYTNTACMSFTEAFENDGQITCGVSNSVWSWGKAVTITSIRMAVYTATTSTAGCSMRLADGAGDNGLAGTELDLPPSTRALVAEEVVAVENLAVSLDAGERISWQVKDGDFCASGTCQCSAGQVEGQYEIWGYFN